MENPIEAIQNRVPRHLWVRVDCSRVDYNIYYNHSSWTIEPCGRKGSCGVRSSPACISPLLALGPCAGVAVVHSGVGVDAANIGPKTTHTCTHAVWFGFAES